MTGKPAAAPRSVLVLIAEDEGPIAEVVSYVVEDAGHVPVVVADGRQALEAARTRWPALVITDLMMPRLSGAELIAALGVEAAAGRKRRPPVILITAASLAQAQAAGADALLRKPFELEDLEALLDRFIGHAQGSAS